MIIVLNWKYKKGSYNFLNYLALGHYETQDDIAKEFNVSIKTVGRWIAELKKQKELVIHRYKNNNFIYLVGQDAKEGWNAYEARHIAVFRKYKFDESEVSEEDSSELPLFRDEIDSEDKNDGYYNSDAGKDYVGTRFAKTLEFSNQEAMEIDEAIEVLWSDKQQRRKKI